MTFRERAALAMAEFEDRYDLFKQGNGNCPECDHDHILMRYMSENKNTGGRWKYTCNQCKAIWYGPERNKYS